MIAPPLISATPLFKKKVGGTFMDQKLAESQFTVAHDLQYIDSWHTKNQILKIDILVLKSEKIEFF